MDENKFFTLNGEINKEAKILITEEIINKSIGASISIDQKPDIKTSKEFHVIGVFDCVDEQNNMKHWIYDNNGFIKQEEVLIELHDWKKEINLDKTWRNIKSLVLENPKDRSVIKFMSFIYLDNIEQNSNYDIKMASLYTQEIDKIWKCKKIDDIVRMIKANNNAILDDALIKIRTLDFKANTYEIAKLFNDFGIDNGMLIKPMLISLIKSDNEKLIKYIFENQIYKNLDFNKKIVSIDDLLKYNDRIVVDGIIKLFKKKKISNSEPILSIMDILIFYRKNTIIEYVNKLLPSPEIKNNEEEISAAAGHSLKYLVQMLGFV